MHDPKIHIRRAGPADVDAAAPLFDAYRRFYEQPPDLAGARAFLADRLARDESVVLLAFREDDDEPAGFAQLFPSFSSVSLAPIFVLNDLFVRPEARGLGVGRRLLDATLEHARATGACRVELETARSNERARRLYLAYGFSTDDQFERMSVKVRSRG